MTRETSHTETQRTVEEYLRGCVGFDIEDNAIATILEDRGIAPGTPSKELTRKQKELCKADLYMWCASTPSIKGSVELQYLIFEKSNKVENEKKELNKCKYNP